MTAWVTDCSFTSALFLPDEKSVLVSEFFKSLGPRDRVVVPALWWYETANVIATAVRRKRISHADAAGVISLLGELGMGDENICGPDYLTGLFDLAQLYGLSAYDAAYLECALRNRAALATLDDDLAAAAGQAGVKLHRA
ncbi:MAG: PIN domain-containing protein [Spirochaetes bacterium]|nr:MAG: PIN domain-containing protein [Spirochaetota bacterium]